MRVDWTVISLLNLVYSTLVVGGVVWYKMRALRLAVVKEYEEIKRMIPAAGIGEAFLQTQLENICQTLREYNARLSEIEAQMERLGNGRGPEG